MLKDKKMKKVYITTEKECTNSIKLSKRPVCTYCGGKREAIETVDNIDRPTFLAGCNACNRFDIGTTEKIYNIALKIVNEGFVAYSHIIKDKMDSDYYIKAQTSGAVQIVTNVLNYAKG